MRICGFIPLVISCLLIGICSIQKATTQTTHIGLEAGLLAGKTLDIYPDFPATQWHNGVFLSFQRTRYSAAGENFGNPASGICLSFHNMGNEAILGYGFGAQYEISWEQKLGSRLSLNERFRPGLIYATNPFDATSNPTNIVIGSKFSALMGASVGFGYQVSQHIKLNAELSIWHSSNGHTALPNVGMNAPLAQISLLYQFQNQPIDSSITAIQLRNSWQIVTGFSFGLNEAGGTTRPVNGGLYHKYLTSIGVAYRFKNIHRVSLSLEGYYDQTYWLLNHSQEWNSDKSIVPHSALMVMLGHEFIYQRWGLVINSGVNLYNPTLGRIVGDIERETTSNVIKRYVPGRFAIRYYGLHPWSNQKNIFLQVGIKSNFGQADFLEFGIGGVIAKH